MILPLLPLNLEGAGPSTSAATCTFVLPTGFILHGSIDLGEPVGDTIASFAAGELIRGFRADAESEFAGPEVTNEAR